LLALACAQDLVLLQNLLALAARTAAAPALWSSSVALHLRDDAAAAVRSFCCLFPFRFSRARALPALS
jgi:hypothetical protein